MNIPIDYKIGIGALVSVVLGWVLGQGATIVKDWRALRRLRHGLITELEDLREDLRRVTLFHMHQLQYFAHGRISFNTVTPITHLFFQTYYKDIFARLNRAQRISYQHTHAAIDVVNARNEEMATYLDKLRDVMTGREPTAVEVNEWGARVQISYLAVRTAVWHVETHLQRQKNPVLDYLGPTHKHYAEFQHGLRDEIIRHIEQGKTVKPEDLDRLDAAHFMSEDPNERTK